MLFWLACEDLKTEQNSEVVEEKARVIYEDYISILSPREVSVCPTVYLTPNSTLRLWLLLCVRIRVTNAVVLRS